jgi:YVTN family beta-propeller protein
MTADPSPPARPGAPGRRERRRRAARDRIHRRRLAALGVVLAAAVVAVVLIASSSGGSSNPPGGSSAATNVSRAPDQAQKSGPVGPPLLNPKDVYAADFPGRFARAVRGVPSRVYVPNSESNTVSVINPHTYKVIYTFPVGVNPQHVVPSYDLKTLWVNNDQGNSLTPIDPRTGRPGRTIPVTDPYNLYFTPDGRYAIVVSERLQRLDFRDAHTMRLHRSVPVPCSGPNHMDFTANGRYLLLSCEFDGKVVKVDVANERVVGSMTLDPGGMPQDVKLSPDGKFFYVADMERGGVWVLTADRLEKAAFIPTGDGAHGLYVSRNARDLYVSNRMGGSVSVISFARRRVIDTWRIPGGGSPDMGGVSADGKVLWLAGRYNAVVYAFNTTTGKVIAEIPVGSGPHGLCVYPQPGRYSLGHTGVFR